MFDWFRDSEGKGAQLFQSLLRMCMAVHMYGVCVCVCVCV